LLRGKKKCLSLSVFISGVLASLADANFASFPHPVQLLRISALVSECLHNFRWKKRETMNKFCENSPSLTILVPLWFIIISLVSFYLQFT